TAGSLNLSGPDAGVIGTVFTPNRPTTVSINQNSGFVQWRESTINVGNLDGKETLIVVSFSSDGTVLGVVIGTGIVEVSSGTAVSSTYGYALECTELGVDCSDILVDLAEQKLAFSEVSIPKIDPDADNSATGPLVLNGLLTW
ncbi:hypothetical protein MNBD_NITROSPIRAE01-1543, partial [hydrothermal vent metagenome]